MNADEIVRFTSQALVVCLLVSLPTVAASALIGLLVAFIQSVMLLQDQSIAYGIKLLGVSIVLVLTAGWAGTQVLTFARALVVAAFYS